MDMIFTNRDITKRLDEQERALASVERHLVRNPGDFADALYELIQAGGEQGGAPLPWDKASDIQRLRPGELSVWAGVNGHGKSALLGQVMTWRMQDQKVLIASLEMKPEQTLLRMVNQYTGCKAAPGFAMEVLARFEGRLWLYDQLDTVQANRILALVHVAAHDMGVQHVVIDSLMKCGLKADDYDAEKRFIDRLQWAAKTLNVHIHLVCHARKGKSENDKLDKFDVKGGSALTDIPDNVFLVQRNKKREEAVRRQEAGRGLKPGDEELLEMPGAFLSVAKNRHGGKEGLIGLWFHEGSGQYLPRDDNRVLPAPF